MKTRHLVAALSTLLVLVLATVQPATAALGASPAGVRAEVAAPFRVGDQPRAVGTTGSKERGTRDGKADKPQKQPFRVRAGLTLTNPLNKTARAIQVKIIRVINHTQRGETIRAASWNFNGRPYVGALTAAHNRGVSVRIIMARTLANEQGRGGPWATLQRNLAQHNDGRRQQMRSWARTCDHSCRGKGGAMHAKFYVFSRSGQTKQIVMNTTSNLTSSAPRAQWNDLFTVTGRPVTYDAYMKVFAEMSKDKPATYAQFTDGTIKGFFYPAPGRADIVMTMLDDVRCNGAKGAGINGKTALRLGIDVFNNDRGARILRKLIQLDRQGCSVKVVYSQAVGESRSLITKLRRKHLVADRNGDGAYDLYLHSKVMAISGHWGDKRDARVIINGSGNWSATALQSDEQGMVIERDDVEKAVAKWINRMFETQLPSSRPIPGLPQKAPYSEMES